MKKMVAKHAAKAATGWVMGAALTACALPAWAQDAATLERGKTLFSTTAVPIACAVCHTLLDAEASGAIGPDLDELKPGKEVVLKVLKEGMGAMPSFAGTMNEADMQAVADYIVKVTQ